MLLFPSTNITPHPRATPAAGRGINFPISDPRDLGAPEAQARAPPTITPPHFFCGLSGFLRLPAQRRSVWIQSGRFEPILQGLQPRRSGPGPQG